jgi:putative restriction endonuclease
MVSAAPPTDPDWQIRLSAFAALRLLVGAHGVVLPWGVLEPGFKHGERSYLFANQVKGIFRPAGMSGGALSIKTTVPRRGPPRYVDLSSDDLFSYALQDRGVEYHDNQLLLWCARTTTPFIYFYGIAPGYYRPIWPVYVQEHSASDARVLVASTPQGTPLLEPGTFASDGASRAIERRYATIETKRRLHQDAFRHLVLGAYEERCAICNMPRRALLDAAHILPDREERGVPSIQNGLALCKLHHSAFDADLIGIRPDRVVEISALLMAEHDGPTLEIGLKGMAGRSLRLPRRRSDAPDEDFLEERYARFRSSA